MADYGVAPAPEGETRFGTTRPSIRGSLYIQSGVKTGAAGNPSCLVLDSYTSAGVKKQWALWADSTGDLRIVEVTSTIAAAITDEDGSGTVVGSQS